MVLPYAKSKCANQRCQRFLNLQSFVMNRTLRDGPIIVGNPEIIRRCTFCSRDSVVVVFCVIRSIR